MCRSTGFADRLAALSREWAKSTPTEIGQPRGRHRFWQLGAWVLAAPVAGYDSDTLRIASLDELQFGRHLHEVMDALGYIPQTVANIMGHPIIECADEYYFLRVGVDRFDPRFDDIEPVVMCRSTGFADMLAALSRELAKSTPTEIG